MERTNSKSLLDKLQEQEDTMKDFRQLSKELSGRVRRNRDNIITLDLHWYGVQRGVLVAMDDERVPIGIVFIDVPTLRYTRNRYKKGQALIWNLWAYKRGSSVGTKLLEAAEGYARDLECKTAYLEWDRRDTPQWVLDWYIRKGYEMCKGRSDEDTTVLKKYISNC